MVINYSGKFLIMFSYCQSMLTPFSFLAFDCARTLLASAKIYCKRKTYSESLNETVTWMGDQIDRHIIGADDSTFASVKRGGEFKETVLLVRAPRMTHLCVQIEMLAQSLTPDIDWYGRWEHAKNYLADYQLIDVWWCVFVLVGSE